MSTDSNYEQKGGNNSTNIQGNNVTIQYGISYSEAREIALELFKNNFLSLSQQAAETAKKRAEELVADFLNNLISKNPESINNIVDPGLQYALFVAQKEYARTGNKDISEIFINILVDRISLLDRDMKQIVYDESLNIITKLTTKQIDTLTIIFLLKYAPKSGWINSDFKFVETFNLFGKNIDGAKSFIDHLIYSGTAKEIPSALNIESHILSNYKYFISKGPHFNYTNDVKRFETFLNTESLKQYFIPNLTNDRNVLSFLNESDLRNKLNFNNTPKEEIELCLFVLNHSSHLEYSKITSFLLEQGETMIQIQSTWNNTALKYLDLTDVGLVISQANYSRRTGNTIRLEF